MAMQFKLSRERQEGDHWPLCYHHVRKEPSTMRIAEMKNNLAAFLFVLFGDCHRSCEFPWGVPGRICSLSAAGSERLLVYWSSALLNEKLVDERERAIVDIHMSSSRRIGLEHPRPVFTCLREFEFRNFVRGRRSLFPAPKFS